MPDLEALIRKLEAATEGSYDLTADLYEAYGCDVIRTARATRRGRGYAWRYRGTNPHNRLAVRWEVMEPFTESIDAAATLIDSGYFNLRGEYNKTAHKGWIAETNGPAAKGGVRYLNVSAEGATPALALCIASLKARAALANRLRARKS